MKTSPIAATLVLSIEECDQMSRSPHARTDSVRTGHFGAFMMTMLMSLWTLGGCDALIDQRTPKYHRPTGVVCSTTHPTGSYNNTVGADCTSDADCKDTATQHNGRCNYQPIGGGRGYNHCVYDSCFSDADCPGTPCDCNDLLWPSDGRVCGFPKHGCVVDEDCGLGRFCSPYIDFCYHYGCKTAYACHTRRDTCLDSADCPCSETCRFDETAGHWNCKFVGGGGHRCP